MFFFVDSDLVCFLEFSGRVGCRRGVTSNGCYVGDLKQIVPISGEGGRGGGGRNIWLQIIQKWEGFKIWMWTTRPRSFSFDSFVGEYRFNSLFTWLVINRAQFLPFSPQSKHVNLGDC